MYAVLLHILKAVHVLFSKLQANYKCFLNGLVLKRENLAPTRADKRLGVRPTPQNGILSCLIRGHFYGHRFASQLGRINLHGHVATRRAVVFDCSILYVMS